MTPAGRNRVIAVVALAASGLALAVIALGNLGQNLVYYWSPAELLQSGEQAYGPTIRLGGVVRAGSIEWDKDRTHLVFAVAEDVAPEAQFVKVASTEIPPQMFRDGIGVVVEGTYDRSGTFNSNRLMVSHSNEYRAPKEGEDRKRWMETIADPQASTAARKE